jgi:hypothetical protein
MIQPLPGTDKRPLVFDDVVLHVKIPSGSYIEEDCTCDSTFMLDIIHEIGVNIRASFDWLPQETEEIHLFMDNAGGHSTNDAREQYVSILKSEFKIIVIGQIANSPETNMLDLGTWVTIQCILSHMHCGKCIQKDMLCKTVYNAFETLESGKLENITSCWKHVLDLIIIGKGSNDLVEQCCGIMLSLTDLPNLDYDDIDSYHD